MLSTAIVHSFIGSKLASRGLQCSYIILSDIPKLWLVCSHVFMIKNRNASHSKHVKLQYYLTTDVSLRV